MCGYIDVRDTARLHVLALTATNPNPARKKRFPLTSPHPLNWDNAITLIAKERPELKPRLLAKPAPVYTKATTMPPSDYQRIEEVFGFTVGEFQTLESTVLDTIDSLTKLEEYWIANGHALPETAPR
jgi:nucleoside-diphosphate-sugar epimerase